LDQFKESSQVFIQNSLGELLLQLFAYWDWMGLGSANAEPI
jgi:hypothetical protein